MFLIHGTILLHEYTVDLSLLQAFYYTFHIKHLMKLYINGLQILKNMKVYSQLVLSHQVQKIKVQLNPLSAMVALWRHILVSFQVLGT